MITKFLISEWIKLRRTSLQWVVFVFFALYSGLIICFSKDLIKCDNAIEEVYWAFFMILGSIIPICLSVYIGIMSLIEKSAGNFKNITASPFGRIKIFIVKNILVNIIFSLAIMLFTILFAEGIHVIYKFNLPLDIFLIGAVCMCISCISLIAIYTVIAFYCSVGTVFAIGVFISIISSILSVTALGNTIWWTVVPITYPIVLTLTCFYNLPLYLHYYMYILFICIFITLFVFMTALLLFKKIEK